MPTDRDAWIAETLTAALDAMNAGYLRKADHLLEHAVHRGLTPTELIAAATQMAPVSAMPPPPPQEAGPMQVTYSGPEPGVRLAPTLGDIWLPQGVPVEVPDAVGRALCEQPGFMPARRRRARRQTETPERATATEVPESPDPSMETR